MMTNQSDDLLRRQRLELEQVRIAVDLIDDLLAGGKPARLSIVIGDSGRMVMVEIRCQCLLPDCGCPSWTVPTFTPPGGSSGICHRCQLLHLAAADLGL